MEENMEWKEEEKKSGVCNTLYSWHEAKSMCLEAFHTEQVQQKW